MQQQVLHVTYVRLHDCCLLLLISKLLVGVMLLVSKALVGFVLLVGKLSLPPAKPDGNDDYNERNGNLRA
jgi:hypothetical protein